MTTHESVNRGRRCGSFRRAPRVVRPAWACARHLPPAGSRPKRRNLPIVLAGLLCLSTLVCCGCSRSYRSAAPKGARFERRAVAAELPRDRPPTAKTLYSMAEILATQGKDAECEFVLGRCLQEHPRFLPAYNSMAELQVRQGRLHEAIETLTTALQVFPRDPVLLNNRGMCLLLRRDYARALEHFIEAAGQVPESGKYRANLATALGLLGRQEECRALLQQILPPDKAEHNAEVLRKAYEEKVSPPADLPPA